MIAARLVPGAVDPDDARRQARDVLGQRRFKPAKVPKPFEGVLRWLGERLRPIGDFFDHLVQSDLGRIVLLTALVALIAVIAWLVARRRAREAVESGGARRDARGDVVDPERLEREAVAAERDGDLERALRLRFRAGLLRLDRAGAIHFRPSLTSGQVARRLHLRDFDDLALTFDAVVYGGRVASGTDLDAARTVWPRVLLEARRR